MTLLLFKENILIQTEHWHWFLLLRVNIAYLRDAHYFEILYFMLMCYSLKKKPYKIYK